MVLKDMKNPWLLELKSKMFRFFLLSNLFRENLTCCTNDKYCLKGIEKEKHND